MEKALIEAVLNKKQSAFTIFYNEIVDHFFSYLKASFSISNEEINDIIADTFIKIWKNIDNFDKEKWEFISWCWIILRNTTKDYFKKKKDIAFSILDTNNESWINFEDKLEDDFNINEELEKEYKSEKIKEAIKELSPIEKEILYLRFSEWKDLESISKIVWLSYSNVRVKIHRLINKLKKMLKNCNN